MLLRASGLASVMQHFVDFLPDHADTNAGGVNNPSGSFNVTLNVDAAPRALLPVSRASCDQEPWSLLRARSRKELQVLKDAIVAARDAHAAADGLASDLLDQQLAKLSLDYGNCRFVLKRVVRDLFALPYAVPAAGEALPQMKLEPGAVTRLAQLKATFLWKALHGRCTKFGEKVDFFFGHTWFATPELDCSSSEEPVQLRRREQPGGTPGLATALATVWAQEVWRLHRELLETRNRQFGAGGIH